MKKLQKKFDLGLEVYVDFMCCCGCHKVLDDPEVIDDSNNLKFVYVPE
ncbi:hypothetical protein PV797_12305 [Clostridiaceae bacterium M8S5]|nr:hypothetical protein PV797_12305 [Clostridiaceae bacterium M8S5]